MTLTITDMWLLPGYNPISVGRGLYVCHDRPHMIVDVETRSAYYIEPLPTRTIVEYQRKSSENNRISGCYKWYFHCQSNNDDPPTVKVSYVMPRGGYYEASWSQCEGDRINFEVCYGR